MSSLAISMVKCATDTKTRDVRLHEVLGAIRTGGQWLRGQIEKIRIRFEAEMTKTGGDLQKAKLAVDPLKKALPAVTWSGRFSYRASDNLVQHSGLFCADLDSLGPELERIRAKLKTSPHLWALFRSPTGIGLKAVFRVPADGAKHPGSFRAVEQHVRDLCGVQIDQKCKDPARLCFISYDSQLYVNGNATAITPLPEPEKPKPVQAAAELPPDLPLRERIATQELGPLKYSAEKGGYFCKCPGEATHTNSTGEKHTIVYLSKVPTLDCQHESCKRIVDAFNVKLRSEIGKAERAARQESAKVESRSTDDAEAELTSFCSWSEDYPAPLAQAAFYGLAGEIIKRIEPHTEADSAALLVQFLVAFGNIIERMAHAVADGAWHYLNLFTVLVGETSKGRKGTALHHMLRFFALADEVWRKNCIASGLSSGEGVIYAVRDEIKETKPEKEKGKYTGKSVEVTTDFGVTDKRLMVIESEICSALKVMSREGNVLSPTLRQAWDTGNLRILTKNSPIRASNAHISIIGHITRHEVRHELTETESANGFGNRILWVAARRSKCLPEGGESYDVNDLVGQLHEAIEFAQNNMELQRSKEARELWARIYPKLSEGGQGLFGAITARAEAQVLRLSCIYALLDCSRTVEVDHLRAALALWRYCEGSARWIFGMGTGSKDADRILAALKAAGEKGLTKLGITSDVFNRNATKHQIDEALRLLHHLDLARCAVEKTGGRSAERWFYKPSEHEVYEESSSGDSQELDTSYSSSPQRLQNVSSSEPAAEPGEPESEVVSGDMKL